MQKYGAKIKKPNKTQKNPGGLGFFKKTRVFSSPGMCACVHIYMYVCFVHNILEKSGAKGINDA